MRVCLRAERLQMLVAEATEEESRMKSGAQGTKGIWTLDGDTITRADQAATQETHTRPRAQL